VPEEVLDCPEVEMEEKVVLDKEVVKKIELARNMAKGNLKQDK
jgi:hypothetical protein